MALLPGNARRLHQLYNAALNLGMSNDDARFYADEALKKELDVGDWQVVPGCAEAEHPRHEI